MILHYGMGENATIYSTLSEHYRSLVDNEINNLIKKAYKLTEKILYEHKYTILIGTFNYIFLIILCALFYMMAYEFFYRKKQDIKRSQYIEKLNDSLILQSHNESFFNGNTEEGSATLTKEAALSLNSDFVSIWMYNSTRDKIICQSIYDRTSDSYSRGVELEKSQFLEYFNSLEENPVIIADSAETHEATKCFLDDYLIPLGIKSMLDVPIWHRDSVIGVLCIENKAERVWKKEEIDYAQMLSAFYSFSYSVKIENNSTDALSELEKFVDSATLISKTDRFGKITYVNQKFTEVSGWSAEESIGQDHHIVNSGIHSKSFWKKMYKTTVEDKKIWNNIVANKSKSGKLYYVDTYIKAQFNRETGELSGFISIRQDVTKIVESLNEIDKKNTYLEHAAKILRHDMHSGINTYIPRGVRSLERRLTEEDIKNFKIESPLRMIKEGLKHAQRVYQGVYEFTNLVRGDGVLSRTECNIKSILQDYLSSTAYRSQVMLDDNLPTLTVNESLFCTALDNLIRNGLKYNDSDTKIVKVYYEKSRRPFELSHEYIVVEDNGRGLTQSEFEKLSGAYVRKEGQDEAGTGLGLNICKAILSEHGFTITAHKLEKGTKLKIRINNG
jgi:PAS domain S-box-containing protein